MRRLLAVVLVVAVLALMWAVWVLGTSDSVELHAAQPVIFDIFDERRCIDALAGSRLGAAAMCDCMVEKLGEDPVTSDMVEDAFSVCRHEVWCVWSGDFNCANPSINDVKGDYMRRRRVPRPEPERPVLQLPAPEPLPIERPRQVERPRIIVIDFCS